MARGASKLGRSVLELDIEDGKFHKGLDTNRRKALGWTDTLGRDIKRGIGQGIGIGGGMMVANAVAGAVDGVKQVVAGSIAAAVEWESAFAGVRKTVDASPEEFAELETSIREMAKEMPIAATELAGLAEAAGALGVAKEDIEEFTRVTALIGTTTDVSSADAATALGQLSNVLGLTGEDYERFASTLVDLGNKGASTESQILDIASRAGAGAALLEMATEETLAWSSAVANLGIEAEAGGSSLQTFFLKSAAAIADGTEKLDKYAEVAGMSASEFKRAFEQDATGALRTFLAGLGELDQGSRLRALSDLGFKDVRITRMLLGLAGNVDNLNDSLEVGAEAWEENTAAAKEAETRFGTTESKLIILGNRVNDLAVSFGEELTPALVDFATFGVEQLEEAVDDFGELADEVGFHTQYIANQFGEQADAIDGLSDRTGIAVDELNAAIASYMTETGASFDEALETVELYGTGNATALKGMEDDWLTHSQMVSGSLRGLPDEATAATEGIDGALAAGAGPIGDSMNEIEQAITKEMQEARANAIDAMKTTIENLAGLAENDESVRDAWQALIDRMDDPYTEAERKADIFGLGMTTNIEDAIATGDPLIVADTQALVNNMLTQLAVMEPGALESGEAVPPAIREGMDAQMSALITYIETNVTGEALDAMTLEEAEKLGLSGIWLYAQGMKRNAWQAVDTAGIVASRAVNALDVDASSGGRSLIHSWANGAYAAYWFDRRRTIDAIAGDAANIFGRSLPRSGPLKGGVASGGYSIIESWLDGMVDAAMHGMGSVDGIVGAVASALAPNLGPMVGTPGLTSMAALDQQMSSTAMRAGETPAGNTYIWQLHVNGKEMTVGDRDDVLDAYELMAGFGSAGIPHG